MARFYDCQDFATLLPDGLQNHENDWYRQIRKHLQSKGNGKGRPPKLPETSPDVVSNLQLIQMAHLKLELGKSWNVVSQVMSGMFHYRNNGFRFLIEAAVSKLRRLDVEDVPSFLESSTDLANVGPWCSTLQVNRYQLLDHTLMEDRDSFGIDQLKTRLLFELDDFRKLEKLELANLCTWLWKIGKLVTTPSECALKDTLASLRNEFKVLNKSKAGNKDSIEELLQRDLGLPLVLVAAVLPPTCQNLRSANPPFPSTESPTDLSAVQTFTDTPIPSSSRISPSKSSINKEVTMNAEPDIFTPQKSGTLIKKLRGELEEKMSALSVLELKFQTLQEHSKILTSQKSKCEEICKQKDNQLAKVQAQIKKLEISCQDLQQSQAKSIDDASRYNALHKRIRRREAVVEKDEKIIMQHAGCELNIKALQEQVKSLQTAISNKNAGFELKRIELSDLKKKLKLCKTECTKLQAELLELQEHNVMTRVHGNRFSDDVRKCVIALQGEAGVSAKNCAQVIQIVGRNLFGANMSTKELPCASNCIVMADEGHVLSKIQVAELIQDSDRFMLHSDGTSRDHKKILGHQMTLDSGQNLSLGFMPLATEDSQTLLDACIAVLQELADITEDCSTESTSDVFREMLSKLCATMSDRASVNKKANQLLKDYRCKTLGTDSDIDFLFCNAHFLLGLSSEAEKVLRKAEKEIQELKETKLGREKVKKFEKFKSSESAASRVIRLTCSSLGPRGDEKSGCREDWLAFCCSVPCRSYIGSYRSNRFNNFFEGAATLFHHRVNILTFLGDGFRKTNQKLESVLVDTKCNLLCAIVRAIGILHYKVTGPYWKLMQSETEYLAFYRYVQMMVACFQQWSEDPTELLDQNCPCIFPEFALEPEREPYLNSLFPAGAEYEDVTVRVLKELFCGFLAVANRQLQDFLPGGSYSVEPTPEKRASMKHCRLTNLIGEYAFGDLDFGQNKMRHTSLHHHSTLHMLKRNKTLSNWLNEKCSKVQDDLMAKARKKAEEVRNSHRATERTVKEKRKLQLQDNHSMRLKIEEKHARHRQRVVSLVIKQGGPVKNEADLNSLLQRFPKEHAKKEAVKNQIRYIKDVLGVKAGKLLQLTKLDLCQLKTNLLNVIPQLDEMEMHPTNAQSENPHEINRPRAASTTDAEPSTSDSTVPKQIPKKKRTVQSSREQPMLKKQKTEVTFKEHRFTRQGCWVAVAYDNTFHIGEVVDIDNGNDTQATVKFLERYQNYLFKYPLVEDVEESLECKHVFYADFTVTTQNGRIWCVPETAKIEMMYQEFKKQFNYGLS